MKTYCVFLYYMDGSRTQVGEFDNIKDAIEYYQNAVKWSVDNSSIDTVELITYMH